ncbi:MAG: hypothetical protein ABIL09_03815, partial [Gemmatimonadota bacterium]
MARDGVLAQEHAAFRRKARQACHQALFYLHNLESCGGDEGALREYYPFALGQIRAITSVVRVPDAVRDSARYGTGWSVRAWATVGGRLDEADRAGPAGDVARRLRELFEGILEEGPPAPGGFWSGARLVAGELGYLAAGTAAALA